jgi:polysaccharide deacetylase family protein (PEP-CTERM system associated)
MRAHHFTVDVEEYFHVSALEGAVKRSEWERMESRVGHSMERLLALLSARGVRATLFVLGWIAERHPDLVRAAARDGHEIASHGWDHRRVTELSPAEFRDSVRRTKEILERLTGQVVSGFRAPSFSIVAGGEWALDILLEEGYVYDSSLFPVRRSGYGYPGGRRDPHWLERPAGRLAEFPPATLSSMGVNLPAGGGAYFRLLPYALVRAALLAAQRRGVAATFYIHPWEWDCEQPRFDVSPLTRIRHYGGLRRTWQRMQRLLSEFHFTTIGDTVAALPGGKAGAAALSPPDNAGLPAERL